MRLFQFRKYFSFSLLIVGLVFVGHSRASAGSVNNSSYAGKKFIASANSFVGDGTTDNTSAIQAAIDSCYNAGGGTVEFSNGVFLTGPITLESNVTLRIDSGATLLATPNMKAYYPVGYDTSYAMPSKLQPLIASSQADSITITGKGTIDGNGQEWWTAYNNGTISVRPRLLQLTHGNDILIENVTLQNSPQFHVSLQYCWYVIVRNVTIYAPANSPNTDGIDPATCHYVQILNCHINTGDDNVAVKSGNYDSTDPNAGTSNVFISGCTMIHGHGISIGSETNGGVDSMLVMNCTFDSTDNGLRIKSYRGAGGNVRNVVYRNIQMQNVKHPIWFSEYYPNIPGTSDPAQPITSTTPYFHDITIDSLTATGGSTSSPGCAIVGLPETPMNDIILRNVSVAGYYGLMIRNATVYSYNTAFTSKSGSPVSLQINGSVTPVVFSNGIGGGNWSSPAAWLGGTVPDSTQNAAILRGDSVVVDASMNPGGLFVLSGGTVNDMAPLSVADTFAIESAADYYNNCPSSPSFPKAASYVVNKASNYVHAADSVLGGTEYDSTFGNVSIARAGVKAGADLNIGGVLDLSGGGIILGGHSLTASSVTGASPSGYVVTDTLGVLAIRGVSSTKTLFPVGTSAGYAPVWIANSGGVSIFEASAAVDSMPTQVSGGRVNVRWTIGGPATGSANYLLQLGWMAAEENRFFSRDSVSDARIFSFGVGTDTVEAGAGSYTTQFGTEPYWISRSGVASFGTFGVGNFKLLGIASGDVRLPYGTRLYQNYPNPFNPTTTIVYEVPSLSHVNLRVFDVLGREVATLVDATEPAGLHQVEFDGSRLSSGVYYYRLESGTTVQTKKLILVK